MLGFMTSKTDLPPASERDGKGTESSMLYEKPEDSADMKLDFQFESELSQLTDDKTTKAVRDITRSIQQSTIFQSSTDLDYNTFAAARKVCDILEVWCATY